MTRARKVAFAFVVLVFGVAAPSRALPTMIRLGYSNCAACHVSPQGGGPLNAYGRAIDEAQSLRAAEYRPSDSDLLKKLSARGRILQDLRAVFAYQESWAGTQSGADSFRPRLMYRNVTSLGKVVRLAGVVTAESESAPRPKLAYDPPVRPTTLSVTTALVHLHASDALEFAVGKDQLPTGLNTPDLAGFIKSRNRYGYYDSPLQAKAYWGEKRYLVMPFVYAPGGQEAEGERESGVGSLAEFDLFGTGKTVVGVSLLNGHAANGDRRILGGYTRLGFGQWGILAEHDVTERARDTGPALAKIQQQSTYAQVFWAAREWLVASAIGERLRVEAPFAERLAAGKVELAARLTNQAAVSVAVRAQRNQLTDAWTRSVVVQAAIKTAQ